MIPILFEDNHCLVVDKPAGLLSQGDSTGDPCVVDLARSYLKERYDKPGNVFLGLVHRLDRPTSGVLLLAKTGKAATRLSEQFHEGLIEKTYIAVAEGICRDHEGEWADSLLKDPATNIVQAVPFDTPNSREANVRFKILDRSEGRVVVHLRPTTGRGHQLRVQLASRGLSIVGDFKYGSRTPLMASDGRPRIALHAAELSFKHPTRPDRLAISASLPADWPVG